MNALEFFRFAYPIRTFLNIAFRIDAEPKQICHARINGFGEFRCNRGFDDHERGGDAAVVGRCALDESRVSQTANQSGYVFATALQVQCIGFHEHARTLEEWHGFL